MKRLLILLGYAAFLTYLSSLQNPPNPVPIFTDKIYHILLYMGFGIALRLTLNSSAKALLIGTGFGVFDEIHQMFVPNRTASLYDLVADVVGLMLAQILIKLWKWIE